MAQPPSGSFLKLQDEDGDSSEPIQSSHTNGGDNVFPQTPPKSSASQKSKTLKESCLRMYNSLPSPEKTPRAQDKQSDGPASSRVLAQSQLPTPPSSAEKVRPSRAAIPSRSQVAHPRPSSKAHGEVYALSAPPPIPTAKSATYSTPPVSPSKPKGSSQAKFGYPKNPLDVEKPRELAAQVDEDLLIFEETVKQGHTEPHLLLESTESTVTRHPTEASSRTVGEDEDAAPLSSSRTASTSTSEDKRPASARARTQSHLDDAVRLSKDKQSMSSHLASTNIGKDKSRASGRTPALSNPGDVVRLSKVINNRSTPTRSIGHCPTYASSNWKDLYTLEGPPEFFYKLPPVVPRLALWPAAGVGIFRNGESLKYFQACDVAVLVEREKGEKVCDTETVNDVGHILHYETGLGKTVTTIALIISNPASPTFEGSHATLVVTPNKAIMDHWSSLITKFTPQLQVCYYDSVGAHLSDTADVVVCTYAQVQRQYSTVLEGVKSEKIAPLFQRKWFRVVLDEAHVARNPDTKTAQAIWALRKWHGLCLTGAPAQNSNHDLYSLFRFLGVTYEAINDLETFRLKVCPARPRAISRDPKILNILKRDFRVVRDRGHVTLPERTDTIIDVILSPRERHVYSAVKTSTCSPKDSLAKITRLRQVCDHPFLIGEKLLFKSFHEDKSQDLEDDVNYNKLDKPDREMFSMTYMSSKIMEMIFILKSVKKRKDGQKTLVFTHFVSVIPAITSALRATGIGYTTYSGDMNSTARKNALKKIAQDDSCTVLISSIYAGGVGIDIAACNNVIILEPWWNPFNQEQAISRCYRIGQTLPVHVFYLVVRDSIEDSIAKFQTCKRDLMKNMSDPCSPVDPKCTYKGWLAGP